MIVHAWKRSISMVLLVVIAAVFGIGCSGSNDSPPPPPPADTQAPSAPTNLSAAAASDTVVNLNWTAATDNVGVTGYIVFRGGAQIATPTGTAYSDTGLTASTTYTYTVKARDAAGNISAPSAGDSATTLAAGTSDTQAPTAPSNLSATANGSSSISLTWTASTDNVAVLGYNVYRAATPAGTPVKVGTSATTSYSDTGLAASTAYYYTVHAYDGANNESLASNQASATTAATGSTTLRVRVVNEENDSPLSGVTVALGNSTVSL